MTVRRTTVRSRNQATVSGHAGSPVVTPAHGCGCGCARNMRRPAVPHLERDLTVVTFVRHDRARAPR